MSAAAFAKGTTVAAAKSEAEIRGTLARLQANSIIVGNDGPVSFVLARINGRYVKFEVALPDRQEFRVDGRGTLRSPERVDQAVRDETNRRWRALALLVKAKVTAIEDGIATFEDEFISATVMPDGKRFIEHARPAVEEAYQLGTAPKLLLIGKG